MAGGWIVFNQKTQRIQEIFKKPLKSLLVPFVDTKGTAVHGQSWVPQPNPYPTTQNKAFHRPYLSHPHSHPNFLAPQCPHSSPNFSLFILHFSLPPSHTSASRLSGHPDPSESRILVFIPSVKATPKPPVLKGYFYRKYPSFTS